MNLKRPLLLSCLLGATAIAHGSESRIFCDEFSLGDGGMVKRNIGAAGRMEMNPYQSCRKGDWIFTEDYYTNILQYCDLGASVIPARSESGRVRAMCRYAGQKHEIEYRHPLPKAKR